MTSVNALPLLFTTLLVVACGACAKDGDTGFRPGSFGPVSANEVDSKVQLVGLTHKGRLLAMIAVDFSGSTDSGMIPSKQTIVNASTEYGHGASTTKVSWEFASATVVVEVEAFGSSGDCSKVRVLGQDYSRPAKLMLWTKVNSAGGVELVDVGEVTGSATPQGFENIRELYKSASRTSK